MSAKGQPDHPFIILASASPRRQELLAQAGYDFVVCPSAANEQLDASQADWPPQLIVQELALRKAREVFLRSQKGQLDIHIPEACWPLILAADTIVYQDAILGKPTNHQQAVAMLMQLRASRHLVYTGVALIALDSGREVCDHECTQVEFDDYSRAQVEAFIAAEPPYDKAGAYAIQGIWGEHVRSLTGERDNVIGLPGTCLRRLLAALQTA